MGSNNKKKVIWFIGAIIVGFGLILGSYMIGSARQEAKLQEQAANYEGVSAEILSSKKDTGESGNLAPNKLVSQFKNNRESTTAAAYLSFADSEKVTPTIASLVTSKAFKDTNKKGADKLAEQGLSNISYKQLDYFDKTISELVEGDISAQLSKLNSSLLIINLPMQADFEAKTDAKKFMAEIDELYAQIREGNPETLIIFATMPATSKKISEDKAYQDFTGSIANQLKEKDYNHYNWEKDLDKKAMGIDLYNAEGSLAEEALQSLVTVIYDSLMKSNINASTGFMGETAESSSEASETISSSESSSESSEEKAEEVYSTETEELEESVGVEYVEVSYLPKGEIGDTIESGSPKITRVTYEVVLIDGVEQSRTQISSVIVSEGKPTIMEIGAATMTSEVESSESVQSQPFQQPQQPAEPYESGQSAASSSENLNSQVSEIAESGSN